MANSEDSKKLRPTKKAAAANHAATLPATVLLLARRLSQSRRQLLQDFEHVTIIRSFAELIELREGDLSFLIDHVDSALVDSRNGIAGAEDIVFLRDFAVGIEVAGQRITQLADFFFLPGDVTPGGVNAYAHDLGVICGERLEFMTVRRHLLASSRSPIQGIERYDDVLLSREVAQPHSVATIACDGGKFEIRSYHAYFEHLHPSNCAHLYLRAQVCRKQEVGSHDSNEVCSGASTQTGKYCGKSGAAYELRRREGQGKRRLETRR